MPDDQLAGPVLGEPALGGERLQRRLTDAR